MNDLVDMTATAAASAAASTASAVLHWSFRDPERSLHLPVAPAPSLRIALIAQLGAHGGAVVESEQGLSSFHRSAMQAVQAAIDILGTGTSLLVDDIAPVAMRAVVVAISDTSDAGRADAISRAVAVIGLSRDHSLLITRDLCEQLDHSLTAHATVAAAAAWADTHPELADLFDLDWRLLARRPAAGVGAVQERNEAFEQLELIHGGTQLRLTAEDCPVTLGRDKSCRVRLGGESASRLHARIEYEHDTFYLVDDSRNGTYLLTPQGEEVFVRGERLPLFGRGVISPGTPIVKQTGEVLRYICRSQSGVSQWMATLGQSRAAEPQFTH